MQNEHEMLGEIIKNARMKADITVEDLAAKVGVGERFIYRIENEGKKPSYDILYKLIRELSILPDQIFFPEKKIEDSEMESLVRISGTFIHIIVHHSNVTQKSEGNCNQCS